MNFSYADFVKERLDNVNEIYDFKYPAIGRGGNGEVYKVIHKQSGLERAIKKVAKVGFMQSDLEKIKREVESLKNLDHPNIVKVIEYYQDASYFYIV